MALGVWFLLTFSLFHSMGDSANDSVASLRQKAVRVALATTSGAYRTGLLTYFTHRDLFPSLMKVCDEPHIKVLNF
jgi:hypothetical protein